MPAATSDGSTGRVGTWHTGPLGWNRSGNPISSDPFGQSARLTVTLTPGHPSPWDWFGLGGNRH